MEYCAAPVTGGGDLTRTGSNTAALRQGL